MMPCTIHFSCLHQQIYIRIAVHDSIEKAKNESIKLMILTT